MIKKKQIVNTFMHLVTVDSLSCQEREMCEKLKKNLRALNFRVKEDRAGEKIAGNSGNIIAELPGDNRLPSILLSAHMDRVKPGKGIKPVIKNSYIISQSDTVLGADDLAGVTGILEALKIVQKNDIPHGKTKVIFTVAEEKGLLGAKNLAPEYYQDLDYGVVFDAAGPVGNIIYQGPTKSKFNATIRGKPSHAAINPDQGIDAIKISSLAISSMNLGKIDQETTANIGVIRGGVARNVVPDFVELEGEVRSHQKYKLNKQINHMKEKMNKYVDKYNGDIDLDIEVLYESFSLNSDSELIKMLKIAAELSGLNIQYVKSCGGNDANIFNKQGLPTVSLAVGAENVHSRQEKIRITELLNLVKYTVNIIKTSGEFL